jgi:anti-sigma B factor antagonist
VSRERYPVLWIGQVAVVTLPAEIDVTNADMVREDLLSAMNQGAALLIADLSKTTFCDSAGVNALVRTSRRAGASEGALRLVVSTPAVQRVFSITGVDRLLDIFPSVAASLAGPYDQAGQGGQGGQGGQAQPDNATAKADTDGGAA